MRPHSPSLIGFVLFALFLLTTIVFFESGYLIPAAQAQDRVNVVESAKATQADPPELKVKISYSVPTYHGQAVTLTATVNITDISSLSFDWNFGDGTSARGQVVQHTYSNTGHFPVRVVVSGKGQAVDNITLTIVPEATPVPFPPGKVSIAVLGEDSLEAQKPITFQATVDKGNDVEFTWDFGDGSPTQTGSNVSHSYAFPQLYKVSVTAENSKGSSTETKNITVRDAPIEGLAFIYAPQPIVVQTSAIFTATVQRGTNVTYQWYISNGASGSGVNFSALFQNTDSYEVRVVATNPVSRAEYSQAVTVQAGPPDEMQLITDGSGRIGKNIAFMIFVTSQAPVTIHWDWGDGKIITTPLDESTGHRYQIGMSHSYGQSRKYPS